MNKYALVLLAFLLIMIGCTQYLGKKVLDPELSKCDNEGAKCICLRDPMGTCCSGSDVTSSCYLKVGISRNDFNICEKAYSNETKSACWTKMANYTNDPNYCLKIPNPENCAIKMAISLNRPDICNMVPKKELGRKPNPYDLENCNYQVAMALNRSDICEAQYNPEGAQHCISTLAQKNNDLELCYKSQGEYRDYCLLELLPSRGQKEACMQIQTQYYRDECLRKSISINGSADECKEIISERIRDECAQKYISEYNNNASKCELYGGAEKQSRCYNSVAQITLDGAYCSKTQIPDCISNIAIAKGDIEMCLGIVEGYTIGIKQICANTIAVNKKDIKICEKLPTLPEIQGCKEWYYQSIDNTETN